MVSYFSEATDVFVGTLVRTELHATTRHLAFKLLDAPFRSSLQSPQFAGDEVVVRTPASSAECGVTGDPGDTFVVFGDAEMARGAGAGTTQVPQVNTCSGTRLFRGTDGDSLYGFADVPGAQVLTQLSAYSGLDALREIADTAPDDVDSLGRGRDASTMRPRDGVLVGLLALPWRRGQNSYAIRRSPQMNAVTIDRVRRAADLVSREVSYEQPAAVVQARRANWYRVVLRDGRAGWLAAPASAQWHPYATVVVQRLNYLTGAWSGHVWPSPGAGLPLRLPLTRPDANGVRREEYPAEILDTARVAGALWLKVAVLSRDPCESGSAPAIATGWVPAFGLGGRPTAWFYSRGC